MNVKLKNKINNELVCEFIADNVKIINEQFDFHIKISISRDIFHILKENNYTVSFEQTQHIFDDNLTDEDIQIQLDKSKIFFINFPLITMDDEMLNRFYSMPIFNNLTMAEKELNKISYIEKHQKIKNTSLFIDDKEVNIDLTIMNDKIIFVN